MPDPYQLDLTAAQVNQAINAAYDSDQAPAAGDTNLVNSDKIAAYVTSAVGTLDTDVAALDGRVTALEGATSDLSDSYAVYYDASGSISTAGTLSGYTESVASSFTTESSGVVTINQSGTYLVTFSGIFQDTDTDISDYYTITPKVGGSSLGLILTNPDSNSSDYRTLSTTVPVVVTSSTTLKIDINEVSGASSLSWTDAAITVVKLN